ncbi:hypothetical protein [Nocardioides flavus (ex Wang et al. 2016)]|nr:hypothetical protein [Nocardioides flavus (ex Wang et al. 2016)]
MPPTLSSNDYSLDFDELYARMWALAIDDQGDGTRVYKPESQSALKWLIADLAGTPATPGQTWPDNDRIRKQAHTLLQEGGWAERLTQTSFRLLRPPNDDGSSERDTHERYDWPTVEWVKIPVDRATGNPNGTPIRKRHFLDCWHWYRDEDQNLLGDPPRLATDEEMRRLAPCQSCLAEATAANNPSRGPRLSLDLEPSDVEDGPVLTQWRSDGPTDGTAQVAVRHEQRHLRRHLIGSQPESPCGLCGRKLPARELVAAHIVPRHTLNEAERLDFSTAAVLACTLGCDALFERGYIAVDDSGRVVSHRPTKNEALRDAVSAIVGRNVAAHTEASAPRFAQHRALHASADA